VVVGLGGSAPGRYKAARGGNCRSGASAPRSPVSFVRRHRRRRAAAHLPLSAGTSSSAHPAAEGRGRDGAPARDELCCLAERVSRGGRAQGRGRGVTAWRLPSRSRPPPSRRSYSPFCPRCQAPRCTCHDRMWRLRRIPWRRGWGWWRQRRRPAGVGAWLSSVSGQVWRGGRHLCRRRPVAASAGRRICSRAAGWLLADHGRVVDLRR